MLALLGAAGGCTGFEYHERGLPKRVDVDKRVEAKRRLVMTRPLADGGVEIGVMQASGVELDRRVVYSTVAIRSEYSNPLYELAEVPTGALVLLPYAVFIPTGAADFEESAGHRPNHAYNRLTLATGFLNPAVSMFDPEMVRDPNVDEDMFFGEPVHVSYEMALPEENVRVEHSAHDASGAELTRGEGVTDVYGRVLVAAPPPEARELRIRVEGQELRIRLRPRPPGAPPSDETPEGAPEKGGSDSHVAD